MPANPVIQNHFTCDGCGEVGVSPWDRDRESDNQILPPKWLLVTFHWGRNPENLKQYANKQKTDKTVALCGGCASRVCGAADKPPVPPPAPSPNDINRIAFQNPA